MGNIIVAFNRTTNKYYVNYAKVVYSVSYSDNLSNYTTTASIKLDFYIKPDNYTYSNYTKDSLMLGVQPDGGTLTTYEFPSTETYGKTVYSATYNLVGSKTFTVTYDGTAKKNISVNALYQNSATARFSPFYMPKSSAGSYEEYEYSSSTSNVITLEKRFDITANTAPTTLTVSPSVFTESISISFSGATAGSGNTISDYSIYARTSTDGSSYTSWTNIVTISGTSYTYTPNISGGYYIQVKVKANSGVDSNYSSGFSEVKSAMKNSAPSSVGSVVVDKSEYTQGESLTISFDKATDTDGNLTAYDIEYSLNSGSWTALASAISTSYTFTPTMADDLSYLKFRVCARDSLSVCSSYTESNIIRRNDYTGINICSDGNYSKAELYVCDGSSFNKAMLYICVDGEFVKGESV